ncbi:MAG: hypothetical protein J7M39_04450, partial [Anaerolineae bacterium]|nr:hypothetical protein [Anaerolineae bacterium]
MDCSGAGDPTSGDYLQAGDFDGLRHRRVLLGQRVGGGHLALWFVVALVFSLAGDIFLMLPDEKWFVPGLLAFLVGHLCYIVGFNPTWPPVGAVALVAVVAVVDW